MSHTRDCPHPKPRSTTSSIHPPTHPPHPTPPHPPPPTHPICVNMFASSLQVLANPKSQILMTGGSVLQAGQGSARQGRARQEAQAGGCWPRPEVAACLPAGLPAASLQTNSAPCASLPASLRGPSPPALPGCLPHCPPQSACLSSSVLSSLRSRCATKWLWQYLTALRNCCRQAGVVGWGGCNHTEQGEGGRAGRWAAQRQPC